MSTKIFNISLPIELVDMIDSQAKLAYASRSEYIKQTIIMRLKSDGVLNEATRPKTPDELRRDKLKEFLSGYNFENSENEDDEEWGGHADN